MHAALLQTAGQQSRRDLLAPTSDVLLAVALEALVTQDNAMDLI